jgi:hypothetical protein
MTPEVKALIEKFTVQLQEVALSQATDKVIAKLNAPTVASLAPMTPKAKREKKHRRRAPIQLCPVPKCHDRAAPVFGMLCAKHKATPKRMVAKFRALRRARKA